MIDKYINEFTQVKENLNVLPHTKKVEIDKYNEYIRDNSMKYSKIFNDLISIIRTRYNSILNGKSNNELESINNTEINYTILKQINPFSTSMCKIGLDINIFRLKQFYKSDLKVVNNIILEIIDSFSKTGINLTINDFDYTVYVSEYMKVILDNSVDNEKILKTFENIYWKCPEVINQISLNFYKIYYEHEKEINKFFLTNNTRKEEFIKNYNFLMDKKKNIIHNDKWYIYDRFIGKDLLTKDFSAANIDRLKTTYLTDFSAANNYNNLIKLESNLSFYKEYLRFQKVIDKMKELYKEKDSYKGLFANKKKEIAKKESELSKLNKKYMSKGFLSPNEKKKAEIMLKVQNIIAELMNLYSELNDLSIKEKISINLSDNSKIPDLLLLASSDYRFIYSLCKEDNSESTIDDAIKFQQSLDKLIYTNDLDIINNINIVDDKNLSQIIVDHYKLINVNLEEEKISDVGIDSILPELDMLLTAYDIERLGINVNDVEFVIDVKKLGIL